ncbi:hypothetical protein ACFPFV_07455 [Salinicoccus siamensis]|uniref:hypothetical protein n=1 Tax=Salinicoccus siamensis TaxID=381830 RepID=UPI00361E90FB
MQDHLFALERAMNDNHNGLNYSYVPIKVKGMNGSTQMISCIGQENKEDIMIKFHDIFDIIYYELISCTIF